MNLIFIGVVCVAVALAFRWHRSARVISYGLVSLCIILAILPFGTAIIQTLENRFPVKPLLPARIDGVLVLGGFINTQLMAARGVPSMGSGIERISELKLLLKHSPTAKIVFTGGSGDPLNQQFKEAHAAPIVFRRFGIDPANIIFEDRSRNTHENAIFTYQIVQPKADENWVLVTSAFHVPRSVGAFRKAGWNIIPYPVDYTTTGNQLFRPTFNFRGGVSGFARALHECLGLLFYKITNRSDSLFPAPLD